MMLTILIATYSHNSLTEFGRIHSRITVETGKWTTYSANVRLPRKIQMLLNLFEVSTASKSVNNPMNSKHLMMIQAGEFPIRNTCLAKKKYEIIKK
jgi:hypothetical protein